MAHEVARKCVLKIGSGSPLTYNQLLGQQDTRFTWATETDDTSDKDGAGLGDQMQTLRRMTITASGKPDWPDTNGIDVLRAHWEAETAVPARIVMNEAGENYTGTFTIMSFDAGGANAAVTDYNLTLQSKPDLAYAATET